MKKVNYISIFTITIIVFSILLSIFYGDYQNTMNVVKSKYNTQYKSVEDSILNTIKYSNTADQIAEIEATEIEAE